MMDNIYNLHFVVTSNSALEIIKKTPAKHILISFYYLQKDKKLQQAILNEKDMHILIDSGLFSFFSLLKDKITDDEIKIYCKKYIEYIKSVCNMQQFQGFFELDLDLINKDYKTYVKPIQNELLKITNKIVLIAQKGRTIEEIQEMCEQNVKCIAIPFASDVERKWFDYKLIEDMAHKENKRIHLLGCADQLYLNDVEQSDSSTWARASAFGEQNIMCGNKLVRFHWSETGLINKDDATQRSLDCINEFLKMEKYVNENKKSINQMRLF